MHAGNRPGCWEGIPTRALEEKNSYAEKASISLDNINHKQNVGRNRGGTDHFDDGNEDHIIRQ